MKEGRPKGITLLGIFDIIQGPVLLLISMALFVLLPILAKNPEQLTKPTGLAYDVLTGWMGYVTASGFFALGITTTCTGIGLLKKKQWAWKIAVFLSLIGIVISLIPLPFYHDPTTLIEAIIEIVLDIIVLYYLYKPHIKEYFDKTTQSDVTSPTNL